MAMRAKNAPTSVDPEPIATATSHHPDPAQQLQSSSPSPRVGQQHNDRSFIAPVPANSTPAALTSIASVGSVSASSTASSTGTTAPTPASATGTVAGTVAAPVARLILMYKERSSSTPPQHLIRNNSANTVEVQEVTFRHHVRTDHPWVSLAAGAEERFCGTDLFLSTPSIVVTNSTADESYRREGDLIIVTRLSTGEEIEKVPDKVKFKSSFGTLIITAAAPT